MPQRKPAFRGQLNAWPLSSFPGRTQNQFDPEYLQHDRQGHVAEMTNAAKQFGAVAVVKTYHGVEFEHRQAEGGPARIEGTSQPS